MKSGAVLLLLLAAACGNDPSPVVDAAPGPDAPPPDGAIAGGEVAITVTNQGGPVAGIPIYFQAADSTLVAATSTDATGTARAIMDAGGFVTALLFPLPSAHGGSPPELVTYAGVKPGDHLQLGKGPREITTFSVTFPAEPTTTFYEIYSACGSSQRVFAVPQPTGTITTVVNGLNCAATSHLAVVARTSSGERVVASAPQAIAEGTTVTITGSYVPMSASSVTYEDLPADVLRLDGGQLLCTPSGGFSYSGDNAPRTTSTVVLDFTQPLAPETGLISQTIMYFERDGYSLGAIFDRSPFVAAQTIDSDALLVRQFASEAAFDRATNAVTWTEGTSGVAPALIRLGLSVQPPASVRRYWLVAAPYRAGTIALPTLPPALAAYAPQLDDEVRIDDLRLVATDDGADEARARAFVSEDPMDWGTSRVVYEHARSLSKGLR